MNENFSRKINPTEAILNAMPAIIEAFVTFYGEEEREYITNKFKNMLVVGYSKPSSISSIIEESNRKASDKLIAALSQQTYPEVTIDNMYELMQAGMPHRTEQPFPLHEQAIEEYKKYLKEMKPYVDYVERCNALESTLEKEYIKKYIEELKDLFTESEYKQIQEVFPNLSFITIPLVNGKIENYVGPDLNKPLLIEAFDSKNEQLLENGKKLLKKSSAHDRVCYFRNFGLDLGDDYAAYLGDPRAKKLTPSKELIERIMTVRKRMQAEMKNKFYNFLLSYQKNRARIVSLDLLNKEDGYDAWAYENEATFVSSNIKQVDGNYIEYPILYLYVKSNRPYLDHVLIHELNHVYELKLQSVQGENYEMTSGWDIACVKIHSQKAKIVSLEPEAEKRDYELFDEIVNELISQEISEILSKQGTYIFNTKEDKKIGGSSYEYARFLVQEFYETYKKEIIASRKNGDMSLLFDVVGKENFEALNQLFHEYSENFHGSSVKKARDDLDNGIDSEGARKLKALEEKSTSILEQMQEYSKRR